MDRNSAKWIGSLLVLILIHLVQMQQLILLLLLLLIHFHYRYNKLEIPGIFETRGVYIPR